MAGLTIPFEGAAHKDYRELMYTTTVVPGAAIQDISPPGGKIKPYGYLRELQIVVSGASGSGGNNSADAPWDLFSNLMVTLPNGQELYGDPNWGGYNAYLAAKHSALNANNDPSTWPTYSATSPNFTYELPIIFEINSQYGWGSLPNTDDSAPYKLRMIVNTSANVWQTAPTTIPTFTVNVYMHCWTIPEQVNRLTGDQQIIAPPGLGTLNKWTRQFYAPTAATAQQIDFTRKGNIIRQLILVARHGGARIATTNFPNPFALIWDGVPLKPSDNPALIVDDFVRSSNNQGSPFGTAPNAQDVGVLPIKFTYQAGQDTAALAAGLGNANYIGTVQSSRLEMSGTTGATFDQMEVLTNDLVVTDMSGSPYSFGYSPYIMAGAQPVTAT